MPVSVPNTSPSPSVSSILKNIRNRGMDSLADNNNRKVNAHASTNFILNTKRHALSASVPSIPLINHSVETNSTAQTKAIFENEIQIDLTNKVSSISKKFNNPENVFNQQLKSKNKRKDIFSSNRNIVSPEVQIDHQDKNLSDCGGSWSKLKANSTNQDRQLKKDITSNEKTIDTGKSLRIHGWDIF